MNNNTAGTNVPHSPTQPGSSSGIESIYPLSAFFAVKSTAESGRGVFATQNIPSNTVVLRTSHIAASVIYSDYIREVCHQCFAYDRGKHWKVRDIGKACVFCSQDCQQQWCKRWNYSDSRLKAADVFEAREKIQVQIVKTKGKPDCNWLCLDGGEDIVDRTPTTEECERSWKETEEKAILIRSARQNHDVEKGEQQLFNGNHETHLTPDEQRIKRMKAKGESKAATKILREAQVLKPDPDTIWYLLDGILYHACSSLSQESIIDQQQESPLSSSAALIIPDANLPNWAIVTALAGSENAYKTILDLHNHCTAYLVLVATMPLSLLTYTNQNVVRAIQTHSIHNVFGIRSLDEGHMDSGQDHCGDINALQSGTKLNANHTPSTSATDALSPGSECLGYAIYPYASYWNHNCNPNLNKEREGREWRFWTSRDVKTGEELCISYLGGDERTLDVVGRRNTLEESWQFRCGCRKCIKEDRADSLDDHPTKM